MASSTAKRSDAPSIAPPPITPRSPALEDPYLPGFYGLASRRSVRRWGERARATRESGRGGHPSSRRIGKATDRLSSPAMPNTALRGGSGAVEEDILGPFPEGHLPEWPKVLLPLGHGQEVVAGELPRLALEARARVGEQDLGLRDAPGVEQDLPRGRVARRVLEAHPEVEVAQRDPTRLAAPADVDELLAVGQQLPESLAGFWRLLHLPSSPELERPGRDLQVAHLPVLLSRAVCKEVDLSLTRSRKRPMTSIATPTSSFATDSAGLWLMPSLQHTKSIVIGASAATCAASCPAPLGNRCTAIPESSTALASRALRSWSAGIARVSCRSCHSQPHPRDAAISSARAFM